MKRGKWVPEEDEKLKAIVNKQIRSLEKAGNDLSTIVENALEVNIFCKKTKLCWPTIGGEMRTRTGKQCRERWMNHLRPCISRQRWSLEEDERLIELIKRWPNRWALVARHLPGRTQIQVKTRWKSLRNQGMTQRTKRKPSSVGGRWVYDSFVTDGFKRLKYEDDVRIPEEVKYTQVNDSNLAFSELHSCPSVSSQESKISKLTNDGLVEDSMLDGFFDLPVLN